MIQTQKTFVNFKRKPAGSHYYNKTHFHFFSFYNESNCTHAILFYYLVHTFYFLMKWHFFCINKTVNIQLICSTHNIGAKFYAHDDFYIISSSFFLTLCQKNIDINFYMFSRRLV